jgi:hypothetical protein
MLSSIGLVRGLELSVFYWKKQFRTDVVITRDMED